MKCPVCPDTNLNISMRHNIEIDYCPNCRGVWLDRGELDKIIERSLDDAPAPRRDDRRDDRRDWDDRDRERERERSAGSGGLGGLLGGLGRDDDDDDFRRRRRKKSFLGELFD